METNAAAVSVLGISRVVVGGVAGGGGPGVGIWGCGHDDPSGQGWDIAGDTGLVTSRDAGSPALCMLPPAPPAPPKTSDIVYNQNR